MRCVERGDVFFINQVGTPRNYVPSPVCHAGRRRDWNDLQLGSNPDIRGSTEAFLNQIGMPLDCDSFRPYEPGRGPKELDEMNAQNAMMEVQQKLLNLQQNVFDWRQQQADKNEKLQLQIEALGQIHHNESIELARSSSSGTNWQAIASIVAAVAALLSLIVSIVALMRSA